MWCGGVWCGGTLGGVESGVGVGGEVGYGNFDIILHVILHIILRSLLTGSQLFADNAAPYVPYSMLVSLC